MAADARDGPQKAEKARMFSPLRLDMKSYGGSVKSLR